MADFSAWVEQHKGLWTRVYDEVIQPDLDQEWKKKEENHKKELKQKDENQQLLFEHLNDEILKTARLTKENAQLKEQLDSAGQTHQDVSTIRAPSTSEGEYRHLVTENEQLKQQLAALQEAAAPSLNHEPTREARMNPSEEKHHGLAERFNQLTKKYQDISKQLKYLERKNANVMQKNKSMKDSVRAWQEYADRQFGKQKSKSEARGDGGKSHVAAAHLLPEEQPPMTPSSGSAATIRTPGSLVNQERSSPAPMSPLPHSAVGTTNWLASPTTVGGEKAPSLSAALTPKAGIRLEDVQPQQYQQDDATGLGVSSHIQRMISDQEGHRSAIPSSSQTTVDEPEQPTSVFKQVMDADDDDVPQFVSERSLKRKRDQPSKSKFEIYADRSSDGTPIKPHRVKEEPHSSPPVSIFTMTRTETMDLDDPAPHGLKTPRHPRTRLSYDTNTAETPRQHKSNSAPLTQAIKNENLNAADLLDLYAENGKPQAVGSIQARAVSEPAEPTQVEDSVLRSLDPNVVSSASEEPPNKRSRQAQAHHKAKHSFLAESGEATLPMNDDALRLPPSAARAQMNQRLQALKNPQTLGKTSPRTPKSESVKIKTEQVPTPPASSSRSTHTPSNSKGSRRSKSRTRTTPREDPTPEGPVWTMRAPETRSSTRRTRVSLLKEKEQSRLRDRPVNELGVKDFKPNPEYNQGYSYAFSETVRKRGDRMCLPGCTNPQCCGSTFRAFAEVQAPLSPLEEEELLEDYLGDAYSNMQLTQMSSEERQELVLQARTKKLAKESGKHREAYERRRTPPGFWRVDFPTTQEQQEDREHAKEQEKAIVQERWLEAHRRGGKWIFRDE
ncbi:hypothetical protein G6011_00908 [Alternaria panax]|uniref:DNA endonuclease activator Ctp1 C-terminal domain-containing protein n=1 Tax=Alternaria panax TaxID=48097 RepID=A0AAD4NV50_9PLEO|nr:hypothetical protein G6011_00908 [Alternaria panax]